MLPVLASGASGAGVTETMKSQRRLEVGDLGARLKVRDGGGVSVMTQTRGGCKGRTSLLNHCREPSEV